jgi:acetyl esterase
MPSAEDHQYELPASFMAEMVDAGGVNCIWANWPGTGLENDVILYFHGGAMVTGHADVNWCARLSCMTGMRVLTVDYPLAPEQPLPAATEACIQAYLWLTRITRPEQIALYGRSAGASLVMLVLQTLVKRKLPLPRCGVPVSSWIPHMTQFKLWQKVVGNEDWNGTRLGNARRSWEEITEDPRFNCMKGELRGLPPLYIGVGSLENVDRDLKLSLQLAQAAKAVGVTVELDVARNLQHCPDNNLMLVPEDTAFVARVAAFIQRCVCQAVA